MGIISTSLGWLKDTSNAAFKPPISVQYMALYGNNTNMSNGSEDIEENFRGVGIVVFGLHVMIQKAWGPHKERNSRSAGERMHVYPL